MAQQDADVNPGTDALQDVDINQDVAAGLDHPDDRIGSAPDIPGLGERPDPGEAAQQAAFPGASGSVADMDDTTGSGTRNDFDDAVGQSDSSGQAGDSRLLD